MLLLQLLRIFMNLKYFRKKLGVACVFSGDTWGKGNSSSPPPTTGISYSPLSSGSHTPQTETHSANYPAPYLPDFADLNLVESISLIQQRLNDKIYDNKIFVNKWVFSGPGLDLDELQWIPPFWSGLFTFLSSLQGICRASMVILHFSTSPSPTHPPPPPLPPMCLTQSK